MEHARRRTLLRTHGTDLAVGLFALGAVLGSSLWIVGAGLFAGLSMAGRVARGEYMTFAGRLRASAAPPDRA